MRRGINSTWLKALDTDIRNYDRLVSRVPIVRTLSWNLAAQAMIVKLSDADIPFRIYNLGAGVKKITTETDICPCCKRRL